MKTVFDKPLGDYPFVTVRLGCDICGRFGSYRLSGLVARYGCAITMIDLIDKLVTDCWRWHWRIGDPGDPCEIMLIDLMDDDEPEPRQPARRPNLRLVE